MKINPKFEDLGDSKISEIYRFNFILHLAKINLEDDIQAYMFDDLIELKGYALSEASYDVVRLVSVFDRVFVCEDIADVLNFIDTMVYKKYPLLDLQSKLNAIRESEEEIINIFLQEYASYEEAYKVALDMAEISPLCYS